MRPDPLSVLRRTIRTHPFLYQWVCFYRRVVLRQYSALADARTELCIEGYPSSGNSFALLTAIDVWPGLPIASHRHCVAAVKRALALEVPTLIVIRDPWDAIASYIVRFGAPVDRAVLEYRDFYCWVARDARPTLIDFDLMLADPQFFVRLVGRLTSRPVPEDVAQRDLARQYHEQMEKRMLELSRQPNNWVVPNKQKETLKEGVKEQLAARWGQEMDALVRMHALLKSRAAEPGTPD